MLRDSVACRSSLHDDPLLRAPEHHPTLDATFAMVSSKVSRILHLRYASRAGNILQGKKSGNRAEKDHSPEGLRFEYSTLYRLLIRTIFTTQKSRKKSQHFPIPLDLAQPCGDHAGIGGIHQSGLGL